jgi:hypothetical protein
LDYFCGGKLVMRKFVLGFSVLGLFFQSCSKDSSSVMNNNLNWKVGTTVYSGTSLADSLLGSWYVYATNSMLLLNFKDTLKPGTYKIVYLAKDTAQINLAVSINNNGAPIYYVTDSGNASVIMVSVNSKNKRVVHIPEVWVYNTFDNTDSLKLSGTVTN